MGTQELFQQAINQGNYAARNLNWETAVECFQKALEEIPDNPLALTSLGQAFFELEKYYDAQLCFTKTAKINPSDPLPLEKMALVFEKQQKLTEAAQASVKAADLYINNKNMDKAIDNWLRAIQFQPENITARTRLAMVYERLGRKSEAVREYLVTSAIYQSAGNAEKAKQVIDYCLQIQPDDNDAKHYLDLLKKNHPLPQPEKKQPVGEPIHRPVIRQSDKPGIPKQNLDPVTECRQKAVSHLTSLLIDVKEDNSTGLQPSKAVLPRGSGGLSMEGSNQARIQLYLSQAIESQARDNDKQAVDELEKAINVGLNDPAAFYLHGLLCAVTKNPGSLKSLLKSVTIDDYAMGAYLLIGQIYAGQNKLSKAASSYLSALCMADAQMVPASQSEELIQSYDPLMLSLSKQTDEAFLKKFSEKIFSQIMNPNWRENLTYARRQLLSQSPDSPPLSIGEILMESGGNQILEALSHIHELINQNKIPSALEEAYFAINFAPSYLPLQIQIADLLLKSGKTAEAIHKFILLSTLYELRGEGSKAVRLLNRVIQMAPMDTDLRIRLINLLDTQGKTAEAARQTIDLADIFYQLTDFEKSRGAYSDALQLAQQSNFENGEVVSILYKMVDIDLQRLDIRQATRVFEQICKLAPNDLNAHMQLVDMNLRLGHDSSAKEEIEHVIRLMESDGKRDDAIEFLSRLVADKGEKLDLRKYLADLLVKTGRIPEAVEQLDAIANSLLDLGNVAGAVTMIKAIIALNPSNVNDYQKALTQIDRL